MGTAERKALRDRLAACGAPHLAAAYEGAVRLLREADFPARRHLLAHLVRDIANGLPEVVTGSTVMRFDEREALDGLSEAWRREVPDAPLFTEPAEPPPPVVNISAGLAGQVSRLLHDHERVQQTQRDKTALLMEALRPGSQALRPALEPVIRDWVAVVRWFQARAHVPRGTSGGAEDDAELERRFRHFEDGLRGLLAGHFEVTREIDEILEAHPPSAETLARVRRFVGGAELLRHFFEHPRLADPRWLPILEAAGFFQQAPEPITDEARGTVAYWSWPASAYLVRMATYAEAQETVTRIAERIATDNVSVHDDIGDIALALPPVLAARLADPLARALRANSGPVLLPKKIAGLTATLASAGQRSAAEKLLKALVEVVPDPAAERTHPLSPTPRTRVAHHDLARLLDESLGNIVAGLGLDALGILCSALAKAMRLSGRGDPDEEIEDHSSIWRPRIEGGGRDDARDVLVTLVRHAADQLASQDAALVYPVIERLERHRWLVFRRLALHVLATLPSPPADLVAERLLDRALFEHFTTCREYRILLQGGFTLLDPEQQAVFLGWVDGGLPAERASRVVEFLSSQAATADDVAAEQRRWQWCRLAPIAGSLPSTWRTRYARLAQEFGQPAPPEAPVARGFAGALRRESAISMAELRAMQPAALAAYLKKKWTPNPDRPFETPRGLAEAIESIVTESPELVSQAAEQLRGIEPTYVNAIITGLQQAVQNGRVIDWPAVCAFARWALDQPVAPVEPEWDDTHDSGWGWARSAVLRLLDEVLTREPSPLPLDLRSQVWSLLQTVCDDPNPQRRGDAIEAAVRYAEWVRILAGQPWSGNGNLDDVPELRVVLDAALDLEASPSPRVHEAVGHQFPWLVFMDEAWVRSRLARIFPTAPEHAALRDAAWHAYLTSGAPLKDRVFDVLAPLYEDALESMRLQEEREGRHGSAEEHFVVHLVVLYGRGTLETRGLTGLITRFFERAHVAWRRYFLWYVGSSLRKEAEQGEEVPAETVQRFQNLWETRRRPASDDAQARDGLRAFGMWSAYPGFDADWLLEQIEFVLREAGTIDHDHAVVERLALLAENRPGAVMRCFGLLVEGLREPGPTFGWQDKTKTILAAALRSGDTTAQAQAIETFNRLGSLSLRRHELLPFSDDLDDPAAIPYFTWDHPMTVAELCERLVSASEPERDRLLGQILREAKDTDVWKFTTPEEVVRRWPRIERHLGKRRPFWELLLGQWKAQGLLAS